MVVKAYAQNIICSPGVLQLLRYLYTWLCRIGAKKHFMNDGEVVVMASKDEDYRQIHALLKTIVTLRHQKYLLLILKGCIQQLENKMSYESNYESEGIRYSRDRRIVPLEQVALKLINKTAEKIIWEKYYG
jgi:hypothetical protein